MAPSPTLIDVVRDAVRSRHYTLKTERAYVHWIRRYVAFHGRRHPREMGASEVSGFPTALATEQRVAASTQNQALAALLFLYKAMLGVELPWLDGVFRAKRPSRLPNVLSRDEVRRLLESGEPARPLARQQSPSRLATSTSRLVLPPPVVVTLTM